MPGARSIVLALLPVLLLLFAQQLASHPTEQIQAILAPWVPTALQDVVLFSRPRVIIAQGTVIGTTLTDTLKAPVDAFRGIPYALPPIGDRRFRRAVAVNASDDIINATDFGPRCPGKQLLNPKDIGGDEDCLTVNVFRPHGVQGKLPVAVYVHGGAYNRGTASGHNTASMVGWSDEPFVAVSFNYRIGALGFLPSTLTAKEGILNLGLHDQILLLQWVRDTIAHFNGDPSQVTLIGLSAGAHSIAHHIMNHTPDQNTSPLFHRAIIESGAATSRAVHPYNASLHESQFADFLTSTGCTNLPNDTAILPCLRALPSKTITSASIAVFDKYNPSIRWAFQPVIDHEIIHRRPIDAWRSGQWNRMPILTGFNTNEGTYYVPRDLSLSEDFTSFFRTLLPAYPESDIQLIDEIYPDPNIYASVSPYLETRPVAELGRQYKRLEAAYGHYAYACPVRQTAGFASADPTANQPVFLYRWALNKTVIGGANHGDQMEYETFDPGVRGISEAQREVAGLFHAYLTSFVVYGDPNVLGGRFEGREVWERYSADSGEGLGVGKVMIFGEGNDERAGGDGVGVAAGLRRDEWGVRECAFWAARSGISE
ncbi:carboxylesterase family protein [Aspergillus eucalypticola CBS 122712]|uniref:Carboxylesterase family protein n=1 Tax=Aspergillus eucalypticola (strain CBS 122712 / IBT 29274) TaxID=1448314 RepID=A0A317UJX1_ASPEC|nr:carboxylesterase family protein [Aspergillus eucalypticola CBS 122712]PWY62001.1 carboxylesterase family protein [Aspergillus eucalypticola CBS 122712]